MPVNAYDIGDSVRLKATFTVSEVNTDPTTITLKVKTPSGVTTSYTYAGGQVTKQETGIYYKDINLDDDGMWYYRWEGTGTVIASEEHSLKVDPSEF